MKRPGPVGLLLALIFGVPLLVEARTLFAMAGIDVPANLYFPAVVVLILVALIAVVFLPEETEGNPNRA